MSTSIQANLWLVYAVQRYGFNNWNAVAEQLDRTGFQHNYRLPPHTAGGCRKRYLTIRKRFINNRNPLSDDDDDEEDQNDNDKEQKIINEEDDHTEIFDKVKEIPLLETMMKVYNQLRQAELKMKIDGADDAQLITKAKKTKHGKGRSSSKQNKQVTMKSTASRKLSSNNSDEPSEKSGEISAVEEMPKESKPTIQNIIYRNYTGSSEFFIVRN